MSTAPKDRVIFSDDGYIEWSSDDYSGFGWYLTHSDGDVIHFRGECGGVEGISMPDPRWWVEVSDLLELIGE